MWIVMHGAITVIEEGGSNGAQEVAEIGEGRSFGELAVMGDEGERQRIATCVAKSDTILGVLHRDIYRRLILRMHEEAKREVVEALLRTSYLRSAFCRRVHSHTRQNLAPFSLGLS